MSDKQRRSKGNGGATKGLPSHYKTKGWQIAGEVNKIFASVFPDSGEGRLMHAILSHTVLDALATNRPKHNPALLFNSDRKREHARRVLEEPMWFCTIAGVSNSYVRRIMKTAYEAMGDE